MAKYDDPEDWPDVDTLRNAITFHQSEDKRLQTEIPEEIICSVFKISTKVIRDNLAAKHRKIAEAQIELIAKIAKETSNKLLKEFELANIKVEGVPKNIEDLSNIKEYMAGLPGEMEKKKVEIRKCMEIYKTLDKFHHKFEDEEEYDKMWRVYGSPLETVQRIEKQQGFLDKEKEKFIKQMENNKKDFNNTITELDNLTTSFKNFSDIENYEQIAADAKNIKQRLDEANEYAKMINNREQLVDYGEDISDYTQIPQMLKDFKSYYDLWTVVEEWKKSYQSWLHDPFDELDAPRLETLVDESAKTISSVIRFFRDKDDLRKILKISEEMRTAIEEFKPQVPIVMALRTDGMKDRHWDMLSQKVGFEVKPYEGFTYQKCIEMKLIEHTDSVVDIGEKAGKEYNIETTLQKMKTEWKPVEFGLKPFKTTGTFTVFGFDDAMAMLDEHIVLTQTMQFSPFKKAFEEEIEEWNGTLLCVSDCIDEWMKCQGSWMYLQPIFDSPDIVRQLPSENKKFKAVDKVWRNCITGCIEDPNILNSCTRDGLLEKF